LLGYFLLSKETWWKEYFAPLEKLIIEAKTRDFNHPELLEEVKLAQKELDFFKQNPGLNSSVYFVLKRKQRK
jgi:hypothetical protein